ncbi:chitinase [Pseudomonas koreensis]|uniref:chitinase n=1 Tax=Pseudomonas koreensis TaxID=198620 RepID=UPI003F8520FA
MPQIDFTQFKSPHDDAASRIPSLEGKKILMGYWHNWPAGFIDGYQRGQFANMNLADVPRDYNVVAVAFMRGSGIPTFKPYNLSDAEFRRQVGVLNSQGRVVLMSLGGANAHIELRSGQEQPLANEIIRLVETYGFDGLDINLEQHAINFASNQAVLPAALKLVKDHYATEGKNFIISMGPEFQHLTSSGKYVGYLNALEGYYDFIAPQFYNQGGDGLWVQEANNGKGAWIAQNNDAMKEDFLYYLTESLVTGTRGFTEIAADKLVIGLPANVDAAASGYVVNPTAVSNVFKRLYAKGLSIKGLMTWTVSWDNGFNKDHLPYNLEFCRRYAPLLTGGKLSSQRRMSPTRRPPSTRSRGGTAEVPEVQQLNLLL